MSEQEELICALEECNERYIKTTHNQKYHSAECCRIATNRKIMEKYYQKRARKLGHVRYCDECGVTKLSRYNESLICGSCSAKRRDDINKSLTDMLQNVSIA